MRIGLMIGSDLGQQYDDRVSGFVAEAQAAEAAGFATLWVPQIPGYFDAMTAITLMGNATERIELGTAVMPLQTRHPVAMAQQALSTQAACGGRFALGLGPSHHWIITDQLGLPYERPAYLTRDYLEVLNAAFAGPGKIEVANDTYRVNSPIDAAGVDAPPMLLAALAPMMLRTAGEQAAGTILWMADQRAVSDHVVPRITKAATEAGRPAPRIAAAVPITLCADSEIDRARAQAPKMLGSATISPNYQRVLEFGDAEDLGDVLAAGSESAIEAKLRSFRDAGVTDLAARPLPLGDNQAERVESRRRIQEFLATLAPQL